MYKLATIISTNNLIMPNCNRDNHRYFSRMMGQEMIQLSLQSIAIVGWHSERVLLQHCHTPAQGYVLKMDVDDLAYPTTGDPESVRSILREDVMNRSPVNG